MTCFVFKELNLQLYYGETIFDIDIHAMFQVNADDPVVTTKNGKVRGLVAKTTRNAVTYYRFMQIPYAKAPLGSLRFQVTSIITNLIC